MLTNYRQEWDYLQKEEEGGKTPLLEGKGGEEDYVYQVMLKIKTKKQGVWERSSENRAGDLNQTEVECGLRQKVNEGPGRPRAA